MGRQYSYNGDNDYVSSTLTTTRDGRMVRCIVTDASGNTITSDVVSMKIS